MSNCYVYDTLFTQLQKKSVMYLISSYEEEKEKSIIKFLWELSKIHFGKMHLGGI